jgi:transcriptional regulator with PAS, ATPase and Fis domain
VSRVATVYSEVLPPRDSRVGCQLVVIEGPDQGRGVRLGGQERVVGSAPGCDLVLTDDRVSARHLSVREVDGRYAVRDLDSTNGTLYEGSRLTQLSVSVGSVLKLGRTFLRIQPQARALDVEPSQSRHFGELVGESLVMREVFAVLELAAAGDVTVLLEGETGTGKELAARALHDGSARRRGPFVAVDCGALPEGVLESELFGHVRGSFTGATQARAGLFARAHGGTLFLDELDGVPLATQARLLRAIEERAVRPVGADQARPVDVRLVTAAQSRLERRVAEGSFRADLFYRISVLSLALPPLRARREDVALLVTELLRRRGFAAGEVAGDNLDLLLSHDWPGNVRELRNCLDRAVAVSPGARGFSDLRLSLAPVALAGDPLAVRSDLPFAEAKEAVLHGFERRYLRDLLARTGGNLSAAARESGVDRKHLRALARRHGLVAPAGGDAGDRADGGDGDS